MAQTAREDVEVIPYIPHTYIKPGRVLSGQAYGTSSWIGLESLLADLLDRFRVKRDCALEFGVEHGYSLVALSSFFGRVIGVDPFGQMTATEPREPMEDRCRRNIAPYANIFLNVLPWQEFTSLSDTIQSQPAVYDLIHVDGEHGYYDTFGCGDWACEHASVVIFHDSISFPETVMPALKDLSVKHDRGLYNFDQYHGLAILVDRHHDPRYYG